MLLFLLASGFSLADTNVDVAEQSMPHGKTLRLWTGSKYPAATRNMNDSVNLAMQVIGAPNQYFPAPSHSTRYGLPHPLPYF